MSEESAKKPLWTVDVARVDRATSEIIRTIAAHVPDGRVVNTASLHRKIKMVVHSAMEAEALEARQMTFGIHIN
jgi:hypothetical protein